MVVAEGSGLVLRDLDDAGLCSEIWTNCSCKTYMH